MKEFISEEEMQKIDEECDKLLESYQSSNYSSFEEEVAACHGITIDEFEEMGVRLIKKIYGKE